jgi:hypothetical protein
LSHSNDLTSLIPIFCIHHYCDRMPEISSLKGGRTDVVRRLRQFSPSWQRTHVSLETSNHGHQEAEKTGMWEVLSTRYGPQGQFALYQWRPTSYCLPPSNNAIKWIHQGINPLITLEHSWSNLIALEVSSQTHPRGKLYFHLLGRWRTWPALFCVGYYEIASLELFARAGLKLRSSASRSTRITGVSHQCPALIS